MGWSAFRPEGPTVSIVPLLVSTTPVQALPSFGEQQAETNYLVSNTTSQGCFLAVGPNSAATVAVIPVAGTPASGFWIPPTSQASYTFAANSWFAAICSTGTTTLYITPGDGI